MKRHGYASKNCRNVSDIMETYIRNTETFSVIPKYNTRTRLTFLEKLYAFKYYENVFLESRNQVEELQKSFQKSKNSYKKHKNIFCYEFKCKIVSRKIMNVSRGKESH